MPVDPRDDPFWNVLLREQDTERTLRMAIEAKERELGFARQGALLAGSEGFRELAASVQGLRDLTARRLVGHGEGNDGLRVLQGKVRALDDVLAILNRPAAMVDRLAAELTELQNQLREELRHRPKRTTESASEAERS